MCCQAARHRYYDSAGPHPQGRQRHNGAMTRRAVLATSSDAGWSRQAAGTTQPSDGKSVT